MVARTRSRANGAVVETIKIESSELVAKVKKTSAPRAKKKAVSKPYIEDVLGHIVIPEDHSLPQSFVDFHTPEFVKGIQHIVAIDPSLYPVIVHKNFTHFQRQSVPQLSDEDLIVSYWYSLITGVLAQQVSGASAKAVELKFRALFGDLKINAHNTLKLTYDQLKSAGFSSQKLNYTLHISQVFDDPTSNLVKTQFYDESLLEEIVEELVKLKGIGMWSAKMFALFTLRDLDVFTYDDLGVARGVARYLGRRPQLLKEIKTHVHSSEELRALLKKRSKFEKKDSRRDWVPLHDEYVKQVGLRFSPYQSPWMLVLWRLGSTNIEILENSSVRSEASS
ncbi:3-methyladenine DNA glycosylase [Suhomyces tanzawaensis NRRL Y-17324]|uniref:3-methyladenine DNA glycosylase n=1 Tax=Suhomyces tanzawaensis NRRL Y-17324 TaxID=984487 RepID=A0A1E4SP12_9ASCO|nr:3-methyladenine DNA glycosylase [Suhomyces tanzawaensis NRRL Y-17324]ODV81147.1 3-methyladenine DNA glycosylase [Suhomyces tanzawaensis NRRL Y-17324]